jgi:BTB/POZ domain
MKATAGPNDPPPNVPQNLQKTQASNDFKKMWEFKDLCDFTVAVGSKNIRVHKLVLALRSSVFAAMLGKDQNVNKLEVNNYSEAVVDAFLRSIYTLEVEEEENAMKLFELATKFDVPELKSIYEEVIIQNMSPANACDALKLGNMHKSDAIINAAFAKIKSQNPESIKSENLKRKPEDVEKILNLQEIIKKAKLSIEHLNSLDRV